MALKEHDGPPLMPGTPVIPIPIREDLTVLVYGIPHDLTPHEAAKIARVVKALAGAQEITEDRGEKGGTM